MKIAWMVLLLVSITVSASAQENASSWEQKKAERFKPISQQDRDAIAEAVPDEATAKPRKTRRILAFYRCEGFIHTSIPHGNLAVQKMADKTGEFSVDLADSYDVFTTENLAQYDCILLNNCSGLQFPTPKHLNAFMDFVAGGKGLAGFHAASDSFGRHPECLAMVGGIFGGHPWARAGIGRSSWMIPDMFSTNRLADAGSGIPTKSINTNQTPTSDQKSYGCWSAWT